jgi:heat shock protein HslJ
MIAGCTVSGGEPNPECDYQEKNMKWNRVLTLLCVALSIFMLTACGSYFSKQKDGREAAPEEVVGKVWGWESTITPVETIVAADSERYTMLLTDESRAQMRFDCNRGGGVYVLEEGKITFGNMFSTRMACPPDTQDMVYMRDLHRAQSFYVENGKLYLMLPYDSGTMVFRELPAEAAK